MKRTVFLLVLLGSLGLVSLRAEDDVLPLARTYPEFRKMADDVEFNRIFQRYIHFTSDKSPDGKVVYALLADPHKPLTVLSTIYHEQVELAQWLKLGHRIEDIMTVEYNQQHYPQVFPIAHRAAVIEELTLLRHWALKKFGWEVPEVAFNLVSPQLERFGVSAERMQVRLRFNLEYDAQLRTLSDEDLERAMKTYEAGGTVYKERARILAEAQVLAAKVRSR